MFLFLQEPLYQVGMEKNNLNLDKIYQKRKDESCNKLWILRGILRKAKTVSKRVMKDAWEKIKEDTYADENTDIWRN